MVGLRHRAFEHQRDSAVAMKVMGVDKQRIEGHMLYIILNILYFTLFSLRT